MGNSIESTVKFTKGGMYVKTQLLFVLIHVKGLNETVSAVFDFVPSFHFGRIRFSFSLFLKRKFFRELLSGQDS